MEKSQEYKFLLEDIDAFNKLDSVPKVTLNEAKLKKEREANKVKNRNRINEELKLHGKPVWKEGEPQPKIDFDYVMDESANIMVDFLKHK